jgi:hypothetical protein
LKGSASFLLGALAVVAFANCGPSPPARTASAVEKLPRYTPEDALLFDDHLALGVLPALLTPTSRPAQDPKLAERARRAEAVVRMRITTVTRDSAGSQAAYSLVLVPLAPPLAGRASGEPLVLRVTEKSPSFYAVSLEGADLIARTLILFFRRYNEQGHLTLHWRAEADIPEVQAAVRRATSANSGLTGTSAAEEAEHRKP